MNNEELFRQLSLLPDYMGNHLMISLVALSVGISICLPAAVIVSRIKRLQWPTLALASVLQTVPGIAMLALMVPLLGMIGFVPAVIALILYSMLPIVRNTLTGILGVDAAITEAARGMGMTSMQMLLKVELPLAAPVILAGIRTATVWVVGTATLSTPVGATSLGNYIFAGLQTQNSTAVLVGCVAAALLALVLDQIIRLFELASKRRSRQLGVIAGSALTLVIAGGLSPLYLQADREEVPTVVVGSKTFTEQYILADLVASTLRSDGLSAETKPGLGSTVLFDALAAGSLDCCIDYSGTLWTNILKRHDRVSGVQLMKQLSDTLRQRYGITLLGPLGFENTYALAMPERLAEEMNITTLHDLARHARSLRIGSDYEFFGRPEWRSLKETYGLTFAEQRSFDPALMYSAVKEGVVDVISAYSTDGRIARYHLSVLADPEHALPPYDAVLLVSQRASQQQEVMNALHSLVGSVNDSLMREANKMVDLDGRSVSEAAAFLARSVHQAHPGREE